MPLITKGDVYKHIPKMLTVAMFKISISNLQDFDRSQTERL